MRLEDISSPVDLLRSRAVLRQLTVVGDASGMPSLADRLVSDELWALVHPLLPPRPPRDHGGRPRQIPDRACFAASAGS